MASAEVRNALIKGIVTCVPKTRVDNEALYLRFPAEEVKRVQSSTGVRSRRVSRDDQCSSDLCVAAARRLLTDLGWQPTSIDLLVFATQTPDYLTPSTSCSIQDRLGLPTSTAAFDMNLGCSAYPYALWIASRLLQKGGVTRCLVLDGETPTKACFPEDRKTELIFGDAGSATALEFSDSAPPMTFQLHTDGSGVCDFLVPSGGFRDRFGKSDRDHFIQMNGSNIFAFTMKRVPTLFTDTMEGAGWSSDDVGYFIFHQANGFILEHLRKRINLPREKLLFSLEEYGNTGGVSIPLTMTTGGMVRGSSDLLNLVLLGYGVGLSWASATLSLQPDALLTHIED